MLLKYSNINFLKELEQKEYLLLKKKSYIRMFSKSILSPHQIYLQSSNFVSRAEYDPLNLGRKRFKI